MDVSPFLMALLAAEQRHMSNRAAPQAPTVAMRSRGFRPTQTKGGGGEGGGRSSLLKEKLLAAQVAQEKAKARALTGRIPTRMATVGGQTFATPDHLAMSGAQRQVFLPDNAAIQGRIGEMSPEDEDFLIRMRAGRGR